MCIIYDDYSGHRLVQTIICQWGILFNWWYTLKQVLFLNNNYWCLKCCILLGIDSELNLNGIRFLIYSMICTLYESAIGTVFSCDQASLWMVFSVCLSVCPSVRLSVTTFWLCSHHRIIMKFSGVITTDQGNVHAKGQGQRSKVKVTEVTTQLYRFRTVTPVWIHIWWWNDAYSLMLLRRGALLFFKVIRQISSSHSSKNRRVWPRLGFSGL